MKENWEDCLSHILKSEGGYVNHPQDPGGETNLGVTRRVWQDWVKREVADGEMRTLTPEMVSPLYKARYWDAVKGDDLPSGLDLCVFDCLLRGFVLWCVCVVCLNVFVSVRCVLCVVCMYWV